MTDLSILELFAGSRSMGKLAEKHGFRTFSSDITQHGDIDYVVDILDFDIKKVPFVPTVIWASPPCTAFSVASIGTHWRFGKPSDDALLGNKILAKTIEIINALRPTYFFIENPRGMMRTLPIMEMMPKHTVTYCQYGDLRMKPTDIWTNNVRWKPRKACKNGDTCHVSAPRGSRTGTQGLKGAFERSKIPPELCNEIIFSCVPTQQPLFVTA